MQSYPKPTPKDKNFPVVEARVQRLMERTVRKSVRKGVTEEQLQMLITQGTRPAIRYTIEAMTVAIGAAMMVKSGLPAAQAAEIIGLINEVFDEVSQDEMSMADWKHTLETDYGVQFINQ